MEAAQEAARPAGEPRAHLALAGVQLCFGLFPAFGRLAMERGTYTPLAVGTARIGFGAASLALLALFLHRGRALPPRAELPRLFGLAILGVAANMTLYLEGLARSTSANAGLMMCLIPVFTFAIAAGTGHEAFRWPRALGLGLALAGAVLLITARGPELASEHALGNALMALNALCYAAYLVLVRPLTRRHPPLVVIAWMFVLSLPWLPLLVWRDLALRGAGEGLSLGDYLLPPAASAGELAALGFILLFPTTLAYLLNTFALSRVRASTTAAYIYSQPFIAAAAGLVLLGEGVTRAMGVAAACIFAGLWFVSRFDGAERA